MTENAELALCAAAFTDPRVHDDIKLTGAVFADARLGAMWDTLTALHEQGTRPDPVTITEAARSDPFAGSLVPLAVELITYPAVVGNAASYAAVVRDGSERRRLLAAAAGFAQRVSDPTVELDAALAYAERDILGAATGQDREAESLLTYEEFVSQPLPPMQWVIPGLLAEEERVVLTGGEGAGKALSLDTPLPTPDGWTTMGEVNVGDYVMGADGKPARVTFATEVMHDRDCYRVEFSDGTAIVADADHLWETEGYRSRIRSAQQRKRGDALKPRGTDQRHKRTAFPSVVTTREIADTLWARDGHTLNHTIKAAAPLDLTAAELAVAPYILGAWLGDGTSATGSFTCGDEDREHFAHAIESAGYVLTQRRDSTAWNLRAGASRGPDWRKRTLSGQLRALGVLGNKHIPPVYLRASYDQRLALLQGLMDTDGTIGAQRSAAVCEFSVMSERLARGVHELALSLGIIARITSGLATLRGRVVGVRWRVTFQTDLPVFRLPRKLERIAPLRTNRSRHRFVTRVVPVQSVPVRCIQVDNADHLYLAGRAMVPTHNTTTMRQFGVMVASGLHPFTLAEIPPRNVLYVDCENPKRLMIERFSDLGAVAARRHRKPDKLTIRRYPQGIDLGKPDDRMKLRYLCRTANPDLLLIGPAYKLYQGGSNSREEDLARTVAQALDDLREEFGFALILEHHMPKDRGENRSAAPIGSSLWMRWPEFGLGIVLDEQASTFSNRHAKVTHWRGARDERPWPRELRSGLPGELPWIDPQRFGS